MGMKGNLVRYNWTHQGNTEALYTRVGRLSGHVGGLTLAQATTATLVTVSVDSFKRRRYPNGPEKTIAGHQRKRLKQGVIGATQTLPGQNAFFEDPPANGKTKVITVTFTGTFANFYQWVQANKLKTFTLRSPDGTPYDIVYTTALPGS